ncbi:MAG: hypothetical protein PHG85_00640 [Candidatus Altiarchaeota archaeon]|nr:hypothetical protein [Candidatus Altiarchaeota archaeon]
MPVKLEISGQPPQNMEEILARLFWKEPETAKAAGDFLQTIKQWSRTETPYTVDQWKSYIIRHEITQSTYHNMLKRLRRAGMLEKKYNKGRRTHELILAKNFSDVMSAAASLWEEYLRS